MRLRTQVLLLQAALVAVALAVAFGVFAISSGRQASEEYGERALAVARTVASDPEVRSLVEQFSAVDTAGTDAAPAGVLAGGALQRAAEGARTRTDALFVVITDDRGLRLAHPDPTVLGQRVSTDPSGALAGNEVVEQERGTLGDSVRAKVPVLALGSTDVVVGEVSVGISTTAVRTELVKDLVNGGLVTGAVLLLGLAGSTLLARRWKRLTLGLEPEELAELVREQEAVLHGIGEGVVAIDPNGVVTVVNDEARSLLSIDGKPGMRIEDIGLTPRLLEVIESPTAEPVLAAVNEVVVVAAARKVLRDNRNLGTVLTVRDRTDVETLTRQLDAVQSMSAVLRAQRHEFANRMHLVSGLLHEGHPDRASQYIDEILGVGPRSETVEGIDALSDAYLRSFLTAKAAHARESGVRMVLGENTWVGGEVAVPVDVTTVLGNLVDNAIDAARLGVRRPAEVEVELVQDGSTLHIVVVDSGDGVDLEVDQVFVEGVSTKSTADSPGGRGVGLALSRQIARTRGGDVTLADVGGQITDENERGGAVFIASIPDALLTDEVSQ
ncbi:histidine kinase [Rhodococcus sp. 06-418-5]|uniref:sensor histidine kinase n=1 Tax=unclassified Rhodococcus (in: high G+C Gram-positive bacteria) TaxID=192944 RepID=UPI000B9B5D94|nr:MULTISPECIES: sensor histidine kinase [unclassified Rhodococcus (in: high G+C Gram-positive bacteria)]OZC68046.1 histidine kinase [Rhodococcus sp. 06-470-2]OZC87608.1 histidine kinase [Rhodococcus sp. 06-418-5]OZE06592.1 histidine kinase [Rhodococcus sp. 05-2255-3C]OZE07044.1 histidine kinase [Rhodococcus sp. 05-2255-3B1]OZE23948.1 histidine kinase [Rhodococcus sp. 05-2255-2A2]